jgi:hypothetical protein
MADERLSGKFTFGDREIELYQPTDGQMFIILGMADLADEEDTAEQVDIVLNFATAIRELFVNRADRQYVHRGLAANKFELPDYMDLALSILNEWAPEQASNREERRAAERSGPAKKAVPAKRATRVPRR